MTQPITVLSLPLPLGVATVNAYVIETGLGFTLIDTGAPNARRLLCSELERLGCRSGSLRLVVLTHGDLDHIGNAAYLRTAIGGRLAMHSADARMAETGDMFANRKRSNPIVRTLAPRLIGFGPADRFSPDVLLEDGADLSAHGFDARIVSIPGHSKGSIGILTPDGSFFCGDLFASTKSPGINSLLDDRDSAIRSAALVRGLSVKTVYPGHGRPFSMGDLP